MAVGRKQESSTFSCRAKSGLPGQKAGDGMILTEVGQEWEVLTGRNVQLFNQQHINLLKSLLAKDIRNSLSTRAVCLLQ